jgi:hypothetical protein
MSNGFFITKQGDSSGRQALPVRGTHRCEKTGQRTNLVNPADYPVIAECYWCHDRMRLAVKNQMEWMHAPLEAAAPASPAGDTA